MSRTVWTFAYGIAGVIAVAGTVATIVDWGGDSWFRLGLSLMPLGVLVIVGLAVLRNLLGPGREASEAFDAGFELGETKGYRAGRAAPRLEVVALRTQCQHCGEQTPVRQPRSA